LLCVLAPDLAVMVVGRVVLGLAVGGASTVVPVYLAELAPYEIRGSLAGRNELVIVSGQLAAFVVNAVIGNLWGDVGGVWRYMLAIEALPAVALFVGMLFVPESPRWLVDKGQLDQALGVLRQLRPSARAEAELADIAQTARADAERVAMGWRSILGHRWLRRILLVGIGIGFFQQLTGINSILYYGQTVLTEAGFSASAALIANVAPGVISVVTAIVALRMIDRISRRKTFVLGYALTTLCHLLIGASSLLLPTGDPARPYVLLCLIVAFVGLMQLFLNIATWVTLSEIFPLHMRAFGMGASVFALWVTNAFVGLYFPSVIAVIGISGSFFAFAALNALAVVFVSTQLPETRGRTLEELEREVTTGTIFHSLGRGAVADDGST
jgi:sugar porter (SP) family MFS transporter